MNQWLNSLKSLAGLNLVDVGRSTASVTRIEKRTTTPSRAERLCGGHGESLRRTCGEAVGGELGTYPVKRCTVNVGTISGSPASLPNLGSGEGRSAVG